jgi:hypothetical protein
MAGEQLNVKPLRRKSLVDLAYLRVPRLGLGKVLTSGPSVLAMRGAVRALIAHDGVAEKLPCSGILQ